jgi:hypothetical protein
VRPLCRKCKAVRSRCAECRAAAARQNSNGHVPGRSAASTGSMMFVVLLLVGAAVVANWQGCGPMPKNIIWLK